MKFENLCVFYASNAHLAVILNEYLKDSREIKLLQDKLNFKNIDLKSTKKIDAKYIEESQDNIVIIKGTEKYRQKANDYIKEIANASTKVINCYDFIENRNETMKIVKESDKILYTTGEKAI